MILITSTLIRAQGVYELSLQYNENNDPGIAKLRYRNSFPDQAGRNRELGKILTYLYGHGYPEARIDSLSKDTIQQEAWLYTGPRYKLSNIRQGNVEPEILRNAGYRKSFQHGTPVFNYANISKFLGKILEYLENKGYPFASIRLDSIILTHQEVSASLFLEKNMEVSIDTIILKGDARITRNYLYQYLGIRPGDLYNESKIRKIHGRTDEVPFVTELSPAEVAFTENKASLYLYLGKKRASQFDGIIGLAPNDQTSGKLLLTGDVKLKLINIIGKGEMIDFNWRKLEESSQDLRLHLNIPYLFKTPFGFDYQFQLYKKDTSYIRLSNHLGLQYLFYGYNYIKAFYEAERSSLISTFGLEFATSLPEYADVRTGFYGLEATYENLDYRFNPRKGYQLKAYGAAGNKKVTKNNAVNPALYDSIDLSGTQVKVHLRATVFFPLARKFTLMAASNGSWLNSGNLFENELYRIGGLKTLRGFDEESLSASFYNILTAEIRYIFEKNSYFSLFWNGAYYEKETQRERIIDRPFGFGAGLSFATRAGIFSVSYALGKQFNNPIDLKRAKIHFGITATF